MTMFSQWLTGKGRFFDGQYAWPRDDIELWTLF
jgi:hypothetical protein